MGLSAVLVALSGLPGTGKTHLARALAARCDAVYLRVDSAEQALRQSGEVPELTIAGYAVLYALAADNLALGRNVIADSVNPFAVTRNAWRDVAANANAGFIGVELICSNKAEHRRRVETRSADIAGLNLPDWKAVMAREYDAWTDAELQIDTARTRAEDAAATILTYLETAS
jgi:predicted kinase